MKIEDIKFSGGDLIIKRVANGWIVHENRVDEDNENYVATSVFEDVDVEEGDSAALKNLILYCFELNMRQKYKGGLSLEFINYGYRESKNDY